MNRLIIASAVAAAAVAVSVPAVAGLSNNPSFSHKLPVHVPSHAKVVELDDHGKVVNSRQSEHPSSTTVTRSGEPEPGDVRARTSAPGDARGGASGGASESGDDSGGGSGGSGSGSGSSGHGG